MLYESNLIDPHNNCRGRAMASVKVVCSLFVLLALMPIAHAAEVPEKEICAAALERLFDRRSISRYVTTISENDRNVHVLMSRKDNENSDACYIQGNRIIWRVQLAPGIYRGRWRDNAQDEVVTYSLSGDKLIINLRHSDGSGSPMNFSLAKLTKAIK